MKNLNQLENKVLKQDREPCPLDSAKILASFFNGAVLKIDEDYFND